MKLNKFRNRYVSLDESRVRTSTFRQSVLQISDNQRTIVKNLEYNNNTLWHYIGRVCKSIREMRKYRQDNFIKSVIGRILETTYHLNEIQEVLRMPIMSMNEESMLTRCTQQLMGPQTQNLRPHTQLIHFMKWFIHFDELLLLEMQKIHESYLHGIQNNIREQLITNIQKQQQLKHQINPRKKDMFAYVNQLVTKPKYNVFSSIDSVEQFETRFGEFNLLNPYGRNFAKQLNIINHDLNVIE